MGISGLGGSYQPLSDAVSRIGSKYYRRLIEFSMSEADVKWNYSCGNRLNYTPLRLLSLFLAAIARCLILKSSSDWTGYCNMLKPANVQHLVGIRVNLGNRGPITC